MNITYLYADTPAEWNSAEWRCAIPARAFNRTRRHRATLGRLEDFQNGAPVTRYDCERADVIVLQRNVFPPLLPAVEAWRKQGKIILTDVDDGYAQMTPDNVAYTYWHEGRINLPDGRAATLNPTPIQVYPECVAKTDGVTAAAWKLAEDWAPRSTLISNFAWLPMYQNISRTRGKDREFWVGWGGSLSHLKSFTHSGILYAIARVLAARPQAKLIIMGSDQRVYDAIPLRDTQKRLLPWVPHHEWPGRLANLDLALAPLVGPYDERRSLIKPLEYSLMGVPWIASDNAAYDPIKEHGRVVANTPDVWADVLASAIDYGADFAQVRRARDWAKTQDIDANVDFIANRYREMKP